MTMFVHVGYNVDKIIASLQMGQAPRNPQSYPLGEPLAFPTLVKANKPSSMGGRYLSSQESSLTPAGHKKAKIAPKDMPNDGHHPNFK